MATATVNGLEIAFDVVGDGARSWVITPGGRFTRHDPGIREMAEALVAAGDNRVLIWDRPNCGESEVCFEGSSESQMQADTLAELLRHLDMTPAVIVGGSGGARVSMLTAGAHPDVAAALAVLWISGGVHGLMSLGVYYCGPSLMAAWQEGMDAVAALPDWAESIEQRPANRQKILDQDRRTFIETMERWELVYCPCDDELVPGLSDELARNITHPTLVFRSGESDIHHTRATSEAIAAGLPNAQLVEPPWGDREWIERGAEREQLGGLFVRWPLLVPQLQAWAAEKLG